MVEAGGIATEKQIMQFFEGRRSHCNTPTCLLVMGWTWLSWPTSKESEFTHSQATATYLPDVPSIHDCPRTPSPASDHQLFLIYTHKTYPNHLTFPGLLIPTHHSKYPQALLTPKQQDCTEIPPSSKPFLPAPRQLQACTDPSISLIRYPR